MSVYVCVLCMSLSLRVGILLTMSGKQNEMQTTNQKVEVMYHHVM